MEDVCFLTAIETAAAVREKRLSPVEIVEAILQRIESVDASLNSFCTLSSDSALAEARLAENRVLAGEPLGPLHGVPVSIKDLMYTRGIRTTRGSLTFKDFVPDEDAPVVERLRLAGAIVLGKTNTPEFGWKGATDNRVFGPTLNPWNRTRTSGGSSGGAAAAVAAGLGPLAVGSDGAGSIRIPASFCGIVGLKPSYGRVPYYPASAADALSHVGPMTRTVADAGLMLSVIAGPDERDLHSLPHTSEDFAAAAAGVQPTARQRIAWSADLGYAPVAPEVRALTEAAARRFASDLGCDLEEASPGFGNPTEAIERLFYGSIGSLLNEHWDEWRSLLDPGLVQVVDRARSWSAYDLAQAYRERTAIWDKLRRFFDRYDALLTPTMPDVAFPVGLDRPDEVAGQPIRGLEWTPFTYPFNLCGVPAISVPCGFSSDGLPVGLQIVGRRNADADVLRLAAAFEAIAPWHDRRPPAPRPASSAL